MSDKYRPTKWAEIVGQPVDEIAALVDGRDTPSFLFYGPAGTGKTTTAYQITRDIHGTTDELLEYNASDDRGIDFVRHEVKPKAQSFTKSGHYPVVFLDEMDEMTREAQAALKQVIVQSPAVFILACNRIQAVDPAIQSRCYDYEFPALTQSAIKSRLAQIAGEHGIDVGEDQLSQIAADSDGDMRKAIQLVDKSQYRGADERISQAAANFGD